MTQEIEMLIEKAILVEDLVVVGLLLLPDDKHSPIALGLEQPQAEAAE